MEAVKAGRQCYVTQVSKLKIQRKSNSIKKQKREINYKHVNSIDKRPNVLPLWSLGGDTHSLPELEELVMTG